jgi:twitching motility protein PilT
VRAAKGAGRVPAVEVMVSTGLIRDYIVNEEKTYLIREAIGAGYSQYGMQTFDQSLFHLFQSGLISLEEALHNASNPDEFRMRVSGILSSDQAITGMSSSAGTAEKHDEKSSDDLFVNY